MCLTSPGCVTQVQGAMAEVESQGRREWYSALAQPDVQIGDYVLTHANLIITIVSAAEAQAMLEAEREWREALERWDSDAGAPAIERAEPEAPGR